MIGNWSINSCAMYVRRIKNWVKLLKVGVIWAKHELGKTEYWVKRELGETLFYIKLGETFWVKRDWVKRVCVKRYWANCYHTLSWKLLYCGYQNLFFIMIFCKSADSFSVYSISRIVIVLWRSN